jgi:hypothetical protein
MARRWFVSGGILDGLTRFFPVSGRVIPCFDSSYTRALMIPFTEFCMMMAGYKLQGMR